MQINKQVSNQDLRPHRIERATTLMAKQFFNHCPQWSMSDDHKECFSKMAQKPCITICINPLSFRLVGTHHKVLLLAFFSIYLSRRLCCRTGNVLLCLSARLDGLQWWVMDVSLVAVVVVVSRRCCAVVGLVACVFTRQCENPVHLRSSLAYRIGLFFTNLYARTTRRDWFVPDN